ncbi:MAG: LysR family transcriptional regulator [Gulosibacter sp.]|uniref:LysR family transcriptional regulator n=1 Tax=Gulosibacter sp. TaxID=2817531 RepID=UPI003F92053E
MKLHQLRAFATVARIGNFTRAAEEMFVTQPSLSRQIATLEADLGVELLHRDHSGITLTDAGARILPIARRILGDTELVRRQLDELAGLRSGTVRLGAPPTLCVSLVADVLAGFRNAHPGIDLHVTEGGSRMLVEVLDEGGLDLALVVTRGEAPVVSGTELVPLMTEELVVISAVNAPLGELLDGGDAAVAAPRAAIPSVATPRAATPKEITLAELSRLPQVAFNQSYDLRIATDAAFAAHSLSPTIAVEGAEMDAVLRFVERGLGVAVVPAMVVIDRPELRSTRLVDPHLTRTVNLARRTDIGLSAAASEMQRFVFDTAIELTSAGTRFAEFVTAVRS